MLTGKNNCGKTSLLEAVSLWANKGRLPSLIDILQNRKELYAPSNGRKMGQSKFESYEEALDNYALLFFERRIDYADDNAIRISINDNSESIAIRPVKYFVDLNIKREIQSSDQDYSVGMKLTYERNDRKLLRSLIFSEDVFIGRRHPAYPQWLPKEQPIQYVAAQTEDEHLYRELFSPIVLTSKEEALIKCLRIIEPRVSRVGFSGDKNDNRLLIKLEGIETPITLRNFGYGMSRILAIILSLVNAENGFLLIDEFENGLHWTVQERLWHYVLELSSQFNVQVFATTHSEDCIRAFAQIVEDRPSADEGIMIRLENLQNVILPVYYEAEELLIAARNMVETRGL